LQPCNVDPIGFTENTAASGWHGPCFWGGRNLNTTEPQMKKLLIPALALTLAEFVAATAYVLWTYGLVGWIPMLMENPVTMLVTFDLLIALGISTAWMVNDARRRGVTVWPFVALVLTTGSTGPLLYAILKLRAEEKAPALRAVAA